MVDEKDRDDHECQRRDDGENSRLIREPTAEGAVVVVRFKFEPVLDDDVDVLLGHDRTSVILAREDTEGLEDGFLRPEIESANEQCR